MDVTVLPSGEVLVLRRADDDPIERRIDVFAQDGTFAGTLPDGFPWSTKWIGDDEFRLIEQDDLDLPYLVRFRVER